VFTARYALRPYIKQIRFVFKGLIEPVIYAKCYEDDQVWKVETGWISNAIEGDKKWAKHTGENLKGWNQSGKPGVDRRIILRRTLQE
jgi:hypothetical protein